MENMSDEKTDKGLRERCREIAAKVFAGPIKNALNWGDTQGSMQLSNEFVFAFESEIAPVVNAAHEEGVDDVLIALSNAAGEFGFTWDSKDHEGSAKRFLEDYCAYKDAKRERGDS